MIDPKEKGKKMKMKKTLLTIAMLTVTGSMTAMDIPMGNQGRMTIPSDMLPSVAMQGEAKTLYTTLNTLKIGKDGASIQIPANLLELVQETLKVASSMTFEKGKKIEKLQLAYMQITSPYWRNALNEVMGSDKLFMDALAKYDADQLTYDTAWMTLRQDAQGEGTNPKADPRKELSDIITLDKSLHEQCENLQKMFKDANRELEEHITNIEKLVKQNIQWILAFGQAINPDFAKSITAATTAHLADGIKALHTSSNVAELQRKQTTAKR